MTNRSPSQRTAPTTVILLRGIGVLILLAVAAGCQSDDIRSYEAPKDPSSSGSPRVSVAPEMPEWTLPDGWEEVPGRGMRFATLILESGDDPLEIRVTPLGMAARDALDNANRWRQQIGLEPVTADRLNEVMTSEEIDGQTLELFNMTGPDLGDLPAQQILAAILPGQQQVWFFMLTGAAERVAPYEDDFSTFMRSVRLVPGGGAPAVAEGELPPGHPEIGGSAGGGDGAASASAGTGAGTDLPVGHPEIGGNTDIQAPTAGGTMAYAVPPGWREERGSGMRFATLFVEEAGETAEVAITRFPGSVGGLLANINRWRGQLGLPPVSSLDDQPIERMEVGGVSAGMLDLVGPPPAGVDEAERSRMLVTLVSRPDMTWFIKMTGSNRFLESQKGTFGDFVDSIRFVGEKGD